MKRRLAVLLGLACLPLLLAPKCFDPPPEGLPLPDAGDDADLSGDGGGAGEGGAVVFVPAVPCAQPGIARLTVVDTAYQVQCGCREGTGKRCTIPRGTRVIWSFADAEEHNVASEGDRFGASGERLTGTYSHTFEQPGRYGYGCTIHTEMSGYSIVVE